MSRNKRIIKGLENLSIKELLPAYSKERQKEIIKRFDVLTVCRNHWKNSYYALKEKER